MPHTCCVCGYPRLNEPPRSAGGGASYEICPSCGFQFGVSDDDRGITPDQWRAAWKKRGAQWSSDQRRILTWSDDHTVRVWDAAKGKLLFTLAQDDKINGAQWSMDGNHILSWSDNQTARVWLVNIPELIAAAKARLVSLPE